MAGGKGTPRVLAEPPPGDALTDYDRAHLAAYLRLLDADAEGAPWEDVARLVLGLDPAADPDGARRCHRAHLDRARWVAARGYRDILRGT